MFAVVPRVFQSPSSAPAMVDGPNIRVIALLLEDDEDVIDLIASSAIISILAGNDSVSVPSIFFDGSETILSKNGDANTTPVNPTTVTAALINKTGGVLDVMENAECNAGLLLAKSNVMKPMVINPFLYDFSTSSLFWAFIIETLSLSDIEVGIPVVFTTEPFCRSVEGVFVSTFLSRVMTCSSDFVACN